MSDTEKQLTPLQELIETLKRNQELFHYWTIEYSILKLSIDTAQSLLPKEKQGIIEAFKSGWDNPIKDAEQFFNSKYNQ